MATIRHIDSGVEHQVHHNALVGRSPKANIRLVGRGVSEEHAKVRWLGSEWVVRDLASTNGTRINDRPLSSREWRLVSGDIIVFGDPGERWCWVDGSAPSVRAFSDDGTACDGSGNLLVLSDGQEPRASVYLANGRWELDMDGIARPISDGEIVQVGQRQFRLEIPGHGGLDRTHGLALDRSIVEAQIRLRVSQDEEQVDVRLELAGTAHDMPSRTSHYMLLVLARLRHADRQAGLPDDECGWIYADSLATQLNQTPEKVNVDIHRIRQSLIRAQLADDVERIVERRSSTHQLRIGVRHIVIVKPGEAERGRRPR